MWLLVSKPSVTRSKTFLLCFAFFISSFTASSIASYAAVPPPALRALKVLELQPVHVLALLIEHCGCNVHQLDLDIQLESRILGIGWRRWRLRILLRRILLGVCGNGYNSGTQDA